MARDVTFRGGYDEDDEDMIVAALSAESTDARGGDRPTSISLLFDVDGCAVAFTLALLTDQVASGCVYVISYCLDGDEPSLSSDISEGRNAPDTGSYSAKYMRPGLGGDDEDALSNRYAPARVKFCLLNQLQCGGAGGGSTKDRVRVAFVCDFPSFGPDADALSAALCRGEPLSVESLRRTLNEEATFEFHDERNAVLAAVLGGVTAHSSRGKGGGSSSTSTASMRTLIETFPRGRRGLTALYIRHEQKTIAAYRRVYGGSATTAFWYVSKFGPCEKTLVLCTRYYLLQAHMDPDCSDYDLQAVKDLCLTYDVQVPANASGLVTQDLTSFAKLSKFCCASGYSRGPVADWFPAYVSARVASDLAEVHALKGFIERDRGGLRISDGEFVKYVYLAHFECYNREQLTRHLNAVTAKRVGEDPANKSALGASAIEGFFSHVRSQLNIRDYIAENVKTQITKLPPSLAAAYVAARTYDSRATDANAVSRVDGGRPIAVWGCSTQMARRIDAAEDALARRGWPVTVTSDAGAGQTSATSGFLHWAARLTSPTPHPCSSPYESSALIPPASSLPFSKQQSMQNRPQGLMIVRRLLALSAADAPPGVPSAVGTLLGSRIIGNGPLPVYRTAAAKGRQLFGVSVSEDWSLCRETPDVSFVSQTVRECKFEEIRRSDLAEADAALTRTLLESVVSVDSRTAPSQRFSTALLTSLSTLAGGNDQKYINRNEIFNGNLAVGHLILDVDMRIRGPVPYVTLHAAMRGFRTGILTALRLLLPGADTDWASHPCYFYKSECPRAQADVSSRARDGTGPEEVCDMEEEQLVLQTEWTRPPSDEGWEDAYADDAVDSNSDLSVYSGETGEWEWRSEGESCDSDATGTKPPPCGRQNEQPCLVDRYEGLCTCREKIGMRVCVPVPAPYVLHGVSTIHGMARVIQQAVLLERAFVETVGPYLRDYDIIDTGVCGHGRSLRMPFFGKIGNDGLESGRLLPFYVVPDICRDPAEFVAAHYSPESFHTHSLPSANRSPSAVVHGLGGDYVSFFDHKAALNRDAFYGPRLSLMTELQKRGVDHKDQAALEAFAAEAVLSDIEAYISAHFPDHAAEYKSVTAVCRAIKTDWVLFQIVPKSAFGYRSNFTCVRYKHRRPAGDTVRTYLSLSVDAHGRLCASISQQCFAAKCGSNKLRTLFTVDVGER